MKLTRHVRRNFEMFGKFRQTFVWQDKNEEIFGIEMSGEMFNTHRTLFSEMSSAKTQNVQLRM